MPQTLAADLSQITLYHNPNCSKSRGALELLQTEAGSRGLSLEVIEYLSTPPAPEELRQILELLPVEPGDLVRNDKNFKALGLNPHNYQNAAAVIALLQAHPELMQRPVALHNGRAAIGRPPEDLLELFS